MRYDIRNHRRLRRQLLLGGLVLLSALVAGGLFGRSSRNAVSGAYAQELGKLNRFIQSSDAKDEAMKVFRQGRDQIEDEDWNGAAATFISFVADYPKHKDVDAALYWTAFALKKQGKFAEADRQLERLIRERPRSNWLDDARAMRVEIAGQTGNRQVVERELDKNDLEIKLIALQSLFQSDPERAAAFVADLLKPGSAADRRLKENAIDLLGQHVGPRTTPMLMELARDQTDPKARKKAIFWLGQSGDESAFNLLKEVATQPTNTGADTEVAKAALFALSQHSSPRAYELLVELARGAISTEIRREAIFWIGQRGQEAAVDDLTKIYEAERDVKLKKQILFSLSQHPSQRARGKLSEIARSGGDVELRKQAIFGLVQRSDEASVEELIKIYDADSNTEVRKQVLFALTQTNSPRARAKLLDVARAAEDIEMRKQAIFWLGQMAGVQVVDVLAQLYDSETNGGVKEQLILALGQSQQKAALRKLMQIAKGDASVEMRKKAIFWLGQSRDPEAVKFIEEILK
jgi:HEAT repeat protein